MRTATQSAIMGTILTPQRWYRIADRMILGMVTRTPPCGFFGGWGRGASSGHETVCTKYVPSKGPSLPNSLLTFLVLKIKIIFVVDMLADE